MINDLFPDKPLPRYEGLVVDAHGHAAAPKADALIASRPEFGEAMKRMAAGTGAASMKHNAEIVLPRASRKFGDIEERLQDLDRMGIDIQVVCPSPHIYSYWADEALAQDIVGLANEAMLQEVARAPKRLVAMGIAAIQHPELAARQVRDAIASGLRGVEISTMVGQTELSNPDLDVFWAAAEETGAVVFIHPLGTSLGARLDKYYLSNAIGQPVETSIALSHLIFSGVFDRFPGLKIYGAHAGGYLPHYVGRSDHTRRVRPEAAVCKRQPSEYLRDIWFDTVMFDDLYLSHLIERLGRDRIMFGTDYAFDMGDYNPGRIASSIADKDDRAAVMGSNAAKLFGISSD